MSRALIYAGVGSRKSPRSALALIERVAERLAELGWMLRSGGAPGADQAFEAGCDRAHGEKQIFLPWEGFENRPHGSGVVMGDDLEALLIAARFHPRWKQLSVGARRLHARNSGEILGERLCAEDAVAFVVAWTPGGRGEGGTGQALRVATAYKIPIVDLAWPTALIRITELVQR